MIRVSFDLIPHGLESHKKSLGSLDIFNLGSGTLKSGNYGYRLFGRKGQLLKKGNDLVGFPRQRLLVFDLVLRVLFRLYGYRNKKVLQ